MTIFCTFFTNLFSSRQKKQKKSKKSLRLCHITRYDAVYFLSDTGVLNSLSNLRILGRCWLMNNKERFTTPYLEFDRKQWATLRNSVPLTLTETEIADLKGINEEISIDDVIEIYLPLSRLLNFYISSNLRRQAVLEQFLGTNNAKIPYIIGIAGSVAVGKSTTARLLQALLTRWPEHRKVDLITTDGFLLPNAELKKRGIMKKKGFPESYDMHSLVSFVSDIKSGKKQVTAPVYSHLVYDIIPDKKQVIEQPDILILEGLNVLQSNQDSRLKSPAFVYFINPISIGIFVRIQSRIIFIESLLCIGLGKSGSTHSFIGKFHILPSVDKFGQCCGSLEAGISVILEFYPFFLFSFFSRYKNNTVGGTRSINSR